jgi:hypothetical protein
MIYFRDSSFEQVFIFSVSGTPILSGSGGAILGISDLTSGFYTIIIFGKNQKVLYSQYLIKG